MSKKTTTKAKAPKATKGAKAATPVVQIKKDAKGRFWVVPRDGGAEQGPFDTKKQALDAKAGAPAADAKATKPAKAKKAKEPKAKKVSAIDAAAQVLAASKEPMNCKDLIEAMARALPCVGTSVGGIPELLPECCLVPVDDAEALASRIETLLTDPRAMRALSASSLETARAYEAVRLRERRAAFYRHVRELTGNWLAAAGYLPRKRNVNPAITVNG